MGSTEALVRRLLALRPNLAVLAMQTYWMLVRRDPMTGRRWSDSLNHTLYGNWDTNEHVYRHYKAQRGPGLGLGPGLGAVLL